MKFTEFMAMMEALKTNLGDDVDKAKVCVKYSATHGTINMIHRCDMPTVGIDHDDKNDRIDVYIMIN